MIGNMSGLLLYGQTLAGQQIDGLKNTDAGTGLITDILPIVFGILGALSLLFVVIGGLRYVISAGNPTNTQKARETIIYALVGLVVSISAFTIVQFILQSVQPDEDAGSEGLVGPNGILTQATQLIVYATGTISVLMIIYGALKFVVSGGDAAGIKTARDTIMYALIGLVVAMVAQGVVTFVLKAL